MATHIKSDTRVENKFILRNSSAGTMEHTKMAMVANLSTDHSGAETYGIVDCRSG